MLKLLKRLFFFLFPVKKIEKALTSPPITDQDELDQINKWIKAYHGEGEHLTSEMVSERLEYAIAHLYAVVTTTEIKANILDNDEMDACFQELIQQLPAIAEIAEATSAVILFPQIYGQKILFNAVPAGSFYKQKKNVIDDTVAVALVQKQKQGSDYIYTLITECVFEQGNDEMGRYTTRNTAFQSKKADELGTITSVEKVEAWANIQDWEFPASVPWFVVIDYGTSAFNEVMKLCAEVDWLTWAIKVEFEEKAPITVADIDAFQKGEDGRLKIDKKSRRMQLVDMKNMYRVDSFTYQTDEMARRKQDLIRTIERTVGFSYGVLSDPQSIERTATELKYSRTMLYNSVEQRKEIIRAALEKVVIVMTEVWRAAFGSGYENGGLHWENSDNILVTEEERKQAVIEEINMLMRLKAAGEVPSGYIFAKLKQYEETFGSVVDEEMLTQARNELGAMPESEF